MASKKIKLSIEEQIEKKEESIKQSQNQKRHLKKTYEQERKVRNKRLIEKGAVFESIFEESHDASSDEDGELL